jgi:hypothetical protein
MTPGEGKPPFSATLSQQKRKSIVGRKRESLSKNNKGVIPRLDRGIQVRGTRGEAARQNRKSPAVTKICLASLALITWIPRSSRGMTPFFFATG